jgi:protein phosphatase
MGTTATVAAVHGDCLLCAQVGDSRAYLLRGGHLAQLTRDQTMVELLKASGIDVVSEDIPTNVILQAVGSSVRLEVVVTQTSFRSGDVVLLCTDGLCGVVDDQVIEAILAANEDPEAACDALVAAANEAGGPDNITVVVLRNDAREE